MSKLQRLQTCIATEIWTMANLDLKIWFLKQHMCVHCLPIRFSNVFFKNRNGNGKEKPKCIILNIFGCVQDWIEYGWPSFSHSASGAFWTMWNRHTTPSCVNTDRAIFAGIHSSKYRCWKLMLFQRENGWRFFWNLVMFMAKHVT